MIDFFFDLELLSPFYCLSFKSVGFRLWWFFFVLLIWGLFFHFITFGLSPSRLGYDGFFFVFLIWGFFFHFIAFGLSPSGLGYDGFLLFLSWGFFFILCLWFKSVGLRLLWGFFVFWFGACFSILLPLGWVRRVYAMMDFFCYFDLGLLFPFYCLWFKLVGFRLWWIFFVFFFYLGLLLPFYCLWC